MKIDSSAKALAAYAAPQRSVKREGAAAVATTADSVAINPLASRMQAAEKAAQAAPAFDAAKVESIRQAIASGQYQINPEAIADGLIGTARELLGQG